MCIIVDANVASLLTQNPVPDDAKPLVDWIEKRAGRLVTGGANADEIFQSDRTVRWVKGLVRAGRATIVRRSEVDRELAVVQGSGLCSSNDAHIIALARASGARVLFSRDRALHSDFRNRQLVSAPRGHVYQDSSHRRLLTATACRR